MKSKRRNNKIFNNFVSYYHVKSKIIILSVNFINGVKFGLKKYYLYHQKVKKYLWTKHLGGKMLFTLKQ